MQNSLVYLLGGFIGILLSAIAAGYTIWAAKHGVTDESDKAALEDAIDPVRIITDTGKVKEFASKDAPKRIYRVRSTVAPSHLGGTNN